MTGSVRHWQRGQASAASSARSIKGEQCCANERHAEQCDGERKEHWRANAVNDERCQPTEWGGGESRNQWELHGQRNHFEATLRDVKDGAGVADA